MGALETWKEGERKGSRLRLMELLLEKGAQIEVLDHEGLNFPLKIAVAADSVDFAFLTRFLLIHGAKKNFADVNGKTALFYAEEDWSDEPGWRPPAALFLKDAQGEAFMQKGYCALGEKNYAEAAASFARALEADAGSITAAYNLGDASISLEQWDRAEESFNLAKDEEDQYLFDAQLYLGIAKYKQGKINDAVTLLNTLKAGDQQCWLHGDLVIETYREILEQAGAQGDNPPAGAVMYNFLGALLLRYKDDEEGALACFQKAAHRVMHTEPGHRLFAARQIIQIGGKHGNQKEVEEAWKIRKEVKSRIAANLMGSGDEDFAQGEFWEASMAYERAVDEGGPNGYASYRAAIAHRRMGGEDFYHLVNDYQQALEAGLFGVEFDTKSGHHNEADVRQELEKLLEQYAAIEKIRAFANTARSYAEAAAAFKVSAAEEQVRTAEKAAEAAGDCADKAVHVAFSAALGNRSARARINGYTKEAAERAEAAKKAAARAAELASFPAP
jgi:tetratricopeptide (TPR) repeat protein